MLVGQWKTEGNLGVVSNWLEFDSSSNQFYAWLDYELRPTNPSGNYQIVSDTILQISYKDYNESKKFAFDSVSQNYIDMWSLGVGAGNLIYERAFYENPEQKIIFFHLSEHEFDSVADLPGYEGLYEVSADFGFYVSKVMDSLKNSSITTELTTKRYIKINQTSLDKFEEFGYGAVFMRHDSVRIEEGIMTDIDYFQIISEFFDN